MIYLVQTQVGSGRIHQLFTQSIVRADRVAHDALCKGLGVVVFEIRTEDFDTAIQDGTPKTEIFRWNYANAI